MHEPSLIRDGTVTSHKYIIGNRLSEDFDLQDVSDDLFRFAIDVRMDEGDMVVARDDVSERRESLLDPLDGDWIWKGIPKMLKLLVIRC